MVVEEQREDRQMVGEVGSPTSSVSFREKKGGSRDGYEVKDAVGEVSYVPLT